MFIVTPVQNVVLFVDQDQFPMLLQRKSNEILLKSVIISFKDTLFDQLHKKVPPKRDLCETRYKAQEEVAD